MLFVSRCPRSPRRWILRAFRRPGPTKPWILYTSRRPELPPPSILHVSRGTARAKLFVFQKNSRYFWLDHHGTEESIVNIGGAGGLVDPRIANADHFRSFRAPNRALSYVGRLRVLSWSFEHVFYSKMPGAVFLDRIPGPSLIRRIPTPRQGENKATAACGKLHGDGLPIQNCIRANSHYLSMISRISRKRIRKSARFDRKSD